MFSAENSNESQVYIISSMKLAGLGKEAAATSPAQKPKAFQPQPRSPLEGRARTCHLIAGQGQMNFRDKSGRWLAWRLIVVPG